MLRLLVSLPLFLFLSSPPLVFFFSFLDFIILDSFCLSKYMCLKRLISQWRRDSMPRYHIIEGGLYPREKRICLLEGRIPVLKSLVIYLDNVFFSLYCHLFLFPLLFPPGRLENPSFIYSTTLEN